MFKGDKKYNEIREKIEDAINEIFIDYQIAYEIECGDIQPLDDLELEETTDKLAEIVQRVLQYQFDNCR